MWGPYTTDDQGRLLTVFGTEQGLRYLIPFHDVDEVIEYLREHATEAGDRLGTMGDDGEKFGAWPTTWEHCWGKGRWVERFFDGARGERRLADDRPPERLAGERTRPIGRVYLPTGSYAEMGEWALPADESREFAAALHRRARREGARGALAARRVLAQLPGEVPRDQRPAQADAPDVGEGRGDGARARRATRRSTTCTAASRTTATGTACSAGSTSPTCAPRRSPT